MPQRKSRRSLIDRKSLPVLLFWGIICYLVYKADPQHFETTLTQVWQGVRSLLASG